MSGARGVRFKGSAMGFSASCPGLVDVCLIFGATFGTRVVFDPVSSEIEGACGSSKIPVSIISLYRHKLLPSISSTAFIDVIFASSTGVKV